VNVEEKSVDILIVEDDPVDAELTLEALQHGKLSNKIHLASDGEEAMRYLLQEPPFENATRPDLIVLDLDLPKIDGREVLRRVRENEQLKGIPIVILTISGDDHDILDIYALKANAYIVKPVQAHSFFEITRHINNFWLRIVSLPPESNVPNRNESTTDS
jgi:CheY-like chemotaxis protein